MKRNSCTVTGLAFVVGLALLVSSPVETARASSESSAPVNEVLDWNQIFIDTLIATNTANSSSQRLGAIVQTAVFDAYNGIERRYTPIFVHSDATPTARRAERQSLLRPTLRWSACSRPDSRRWMPAMPYRWRH